MPEALLPTLPVMPCPRCGTIDTPLLGPGAGPHVARANCPSCMAFIRWIPKRLIEGYVPVDRPLSPDRRGTGSLGHPRL
jgi:hypothetical protein